MAFPQPYPGVYRIRGQLHTLNAVRGFKVHGETVYYDGDKEYRLWAPQHSKLCAAMAKGLQTFPFTPGAKVLYLGAAQGVTPSFLADIVGPEGEIFGVEISKRALRDLIFVCEKRPNIYPILADASQPQEYSSDVGQVDVVYEDVAARDQDGILIYNAVACLKPGGIAMLAIKSQSIDSAAPPETIYKKVLDRIASDKTANLELLEAIRLDPLEKDHCFAVFRKKA